MNDVTVVIAEDDPKISEIQSRFIEKVEGFQVVGIGNSIAETEDIIDVFKPDLVLLDIYFPDGSGLDLLWKIRLLYKQIDVILITSSKEVHSLQDAIRGGAFDYILKPMTFNRLRKALLDFRKHRKKLRDIIQLDQADVDQLIRPSVEPPVAEVRIPKSIDPLTLERVEAEMKRLRGEGINAQTLGLRLGISRTTARRYLEFLVSRGVVKPNLVYGSVGRPERLYFQTN